MHRTDKLPRRSWPRSKRTRARLRRREARLAIAVAVDYDMLELGAAS